jgi:hypothetical protein
MGFDFKIFLGKLGCDDVNAMEPAKSSVQGKAFFNPMMKFGCYDRKKLFFFLNFEKSSQKCPL